MKKLSIILISFLMSLFVIACSKSDAIEKEENTIKGELTGKTIILHTNDIHGGYIPEEDTDTQDGGLEGYAAIATVKKEFEEKGANVILVDGGDFSQGSVYVFDNKGQASCELMDQIGYDVVTLGNHEFDYGIEQLQDNLKDRFYKVVCANVKKGDEYFYDPNCVIKVGKLKIAFFGLLTPETQTKANPNFSKGLTFAEGTDLYTEAQAQIDECKKKADLVICLSHLGIAEESIGNKSIDVYKNTQGVDFIIDGHSHNVMTEGPNNEPIQSTGTKCTNIGVIEIDNATKKIEKNYLLPLKDVKADATILELAKEIMSEVDKKYDSVFANTEVELNGVKDFVRTQETNLGDLITDAMVWEVLKFGSIDVEDDHIVAVTNGGGIRASIGIGGITKRDINTVLPFGNTLAVNYISGAELLEALEASTFCTPGTVGGFPHIANMKITIDTTKEFDAGEEYPESTYCKPNSIQRISIESINGKAFNENDTYAVITNDFCAAGGDTYYAFKRAFDLGKGFDTGMALDQAVIDFIENELDGKIGQEYALAQGRITIIQ